MTLTAHLDAVEILLGQATPAEARVYVRLRGDVAAGSRLSGTVRGPRSHYHKTLQADIPLLDRGPGESLLAEALVLDPCFWTPGCPHQYQLTVRLLTADGEVAGAAERRFGLRHLGVVDNGIRWDHQPFVLRGIRCAEEPPLDDLESWHDEEWGAVVTRASDVFLEEASRVGVAVVAEVAGTAEQCRDEIVRLAQWPAVMMAIVDCQATLPADAARQGMLLAQRVSQANPTPADWAQVVICTGGDVVDTPSKPMMIESPNMAGDRTSAAEMFPAMEHASACGYLL